MAAADDEIKKIKEAAEQGRKSVTELQKELEKLFSSGVSLSNAQKKEIANIASTYTKVNTALEKVKKSNTSYKKDVEDILDLAEEINESLQNTEGLYTKINKKIKEQITELNTKKSIEEKFGAINKDNLGKLAKNNILLDVSVRSLKEQLTQVRLIEASALYSKGFENGLISEDVVKYLQEAGAGVDVIDTIYSRITKKQKLQNKLLSEIDESKREKILNKIQRLQITINQNIKEYNAEIFEAIDNQKKSIQTLYSELAVRKNIEDIYERHKQDIDETYTKYAAIASLIPVIGKGLSKSFLEAKQISIDALTEVKDVFLETQDPIKAIQAGWSKLTQGLGKTLGVLAIIALVLKGVYDLFTGINKTTKEIQSQTGLASDQAYNLYKNALNAQTTFHNQLSTLEDILAVQNAIVNSYGRNVELSGEVLAQVSDAAKVFGYSAETAGQLQTTFMQLGADESLAGNLQVAVGELARANKIAPGIIAKDLVDNAEYVATVFAGMPKEAAKAAVEVRKMGFSLGQAAKVSQFLFDIPGSLTAAMEASVGLGKLIDTNAARAYAMEGQTAKMMDEIAKQAGSYAEFTDMSVAQRMLLADAFGMEVTELQRSMYIRENLSDLSDEEYKAAEKHLKTLENVEKMDRAQLKAEISKAQQAEKFDVAMSKIKNALISAILPVAEALIPIFETLANIISALVIPIKIIKIIFQAIGGLLELILSPLTLINDIINHGFVEGISKTAEGFDTVWGRLKIISAILIGVPLLVVGISKAFFGIQAAMQGGFSLAPVKKFFSTTMSGVGGLKEGLTSTFSKVKEGLLGKSYKGGQFMPGGKRAKAGGERAGGLRDKLTGASQRTTDSSSGKAGGLRDKLTGASQRTTDSSSGKAGGKKRGKGAGGGMLSSLSSVNTTALIKGAAAMAIVSAAVYVFAKALQELEKIKDWQTVAIGLGAFAASMGLIAIVGRPAQAGLQALGQGLIALGGAVSTGVGAVGLLALAGLALAFGKALQWAAPAIEAFASVIESVGPIILGIFSTIADVIKTAISGVVDAFKYIFDGLTLEKAAAIYAISGGFIALAASMAALTGVGIVSSIFGGVEEVIEDVGNAAIAYVNPITQLSNSIYTLITSLDKLINLDSSKISENLKAIGSVSLSNISDIPKQLEANQKTLVDGSDSLVEKVGETKVTTNKEISKAPINKTIEETQTSTTNTPSFEQRNEALGGTNTAALLTRLVALMEANTTNPPRLVLEFGDGTISEIKGRIKKTM
jgi:hypothetical protein